MSLLEMHNPSDHIYVTKEDIDHIKQNSESTVTTQYGKLQFDTLSRQRLEDVIESLGSKETIEWGFIGTSAVLTKKELVDMYAKAKKDAGIKSANLYIIAKTMKDTIKTGSKITLSEAEKLLEVPIA